MFSGNPQVSPLIRTLQPTACNSGTADLVDSGQFVGKIYFYVSHAGTNDTDLVVGIYESDAAGGTPDAIATTMPIWLDADHGTTSDTFVRQTDAATLTIDPATQGSALACFEVDPSILSSGHPWVGLQRVSGGHGSNTYSVYCVGQRRYPQATVPTVIA